MRQVLMDKTLHPLNPELPIRETLCWKRLLQGTVMVVFSLQSCLMGPEYHQPDSASPLHWDVMILNGDASHLPIAMADVPEVSWWRAFQNEELNSLIERNYSPPSALTYLHS